MKRTLEERGCDNLDIAILDELQANGRISVADLARKIHLSQPAVHNRIKRLEREGIITQYVALLHHEQIGYDLLCFLQITIRPHAAAVLRGIEDHIQPLPQVLECYRLTGQSDLILKVVVENHSQLNDLVAALNGLDGIERIETNVVLRPVKQTTRLSLE
jgi:Lrp/AsnC family transcriptional regulator, leucine-responsive regulatory protein